MFSMIPHLWEKLVGKRCAHSPRPRKLAKRLPRRGTVQLTLEILEARELLTAYFWNGIVGGQVKNWSTPGNWLYNDPKMGWTQSQVVPGANDDLWFSLKDANGNPVAATLTDSTEDANFGGTVHLLHLDAAFANMIILNKDLMVTTVSVR